MKVILTGGGTGGHIYPALAIAQGLKMRVPDVDILYVGTKEGMESTIVPRAGLKFAPVDVKGINRDSFLKASRDLAKFPLSIFQGWGIIRDFQPDLVIGTGGYVSFPVVLASTFLPSCRTLIHEQNAIPGLANRRLASRVDCVMLNFEEAGQYIKARSVKVTGLPVRKEIQALSGQGRNKPGSSSNSFTLLAFGGSRGSARINKAMAELVERCQQESMEIIWITGEEHFASTQDEVSRHLDQVRMKLNLRLLPYMYNIEEAFQKADLVVCRAGASTLSELCLLGLPAILVPYPYAADNHQEYNARVLLNKNAAEMVIDEFLDGDTLYKKMQPLRADHSRLGIMAENMLKQGKPGALKDILEAALEGIKGA